MYSFGVILWELWSGQKPWDGFSDLHIMRSLDRGKRLEVPSNCPVAVAELMVQCFGEASTRPSFEEIREVLETQLH